nr:MAG TPA: hypothetical protein [Crassvirales sp.]
MFFFCNLWIKNSYKIITFLYHLFMKVYTF